MNSILGYFDGKHIIPEQELFLKKNQKVVITVLGEGKLKEIRRNDIEPNRALFNPEEFKGVLKVDNIKEDLEMLRNEWERIQCT